MANLGMSKQRFVALWRRCLSVEAAQDGAEVYEQLLKQYSEPHRCYHTPDHIGHCLREFDFARDEMIDADAVEMGLWFHDAVYCPRSSDNELKSAESFSTSVHGEVQAEFRLRVHDLILVTTHAEQPSSLDQQFMLDIDLSSFGVSWTAFLRDSLAVRKEFAFMSDDQFYRNRIQFLESLLARPAIFSTDSFRRKFEAASRRNITRHLEDIRRFAS